MDRQEDIREVERKGNEKDLRVRGKRRRNGMRWMEDGMKEGKKREKERK